MHTMISRNKGITLIEMAITIAVLTVLTGAVLVSVPFDLLSNLRQKNHKDSVGIVLDAYYQVNIGNLVFPTAADVILTTISFDEIEAIGRNLKLNQEINFSQDSGGRNWFYAQCSTSGFLDHADIFVSIDSSTKISYCGLVAYTTGEAGAPLANDVIKNKTIADWQNATVNPAIEDYVIVEGRRGVSAEINKTSDKLNAVVTAFEEYYRLLDSNDPVAGIAINRFSHTPSQNYDLQRRTIDKISILRNTEVKANDDHLLTRSYQAIMKISDETLNTGFGEIQFDNGSTSIRTSSHTTPAYKVYQGPPYTVELWVELSGNGAIMRKTASSKIYGY